MILKNCGHRRPIPTYIIRVVYNACQSSAAMAYVNGVYFFLSRVVFSILFFSLRIFFSYFFLPLTNSTLLQAQVPSFMTLVTDTDPRCVLL